MLFNFRRTEGRAEGNDGRTEGSAGRTVQQANGGAGGRFRRTHERAMVGWPPGRSNGRAENNTKTTPTDGRTTDAQTHTVRSHAGKRPL